MSKLDLTIVIPVFNNQDTIRELVLRIQKTVQKLNLIFEIILINDGSNDNSWDIISKITNENKIIKGLNLSRNFGQHPAILAGLEYCNSKWIIVMDADLQDKPEEIIKLYSKALEGNDLVVGIKSYRKDSFFKKIGSKLFLKLYSFLSNTKVTINIGNFGIYSQSVIESILKMGDYHRTFGLCAIWVGFKRTEVEIEHLRRENSKSTYTLSKMFDLAINTIFFNTDKLIYIFFFFGFLLSIMSFLFLIFLVFKFFYFSVPLEGWTSIMVSIFFLGGVMIFFMGIIGIYASKIFEQVKTRPVYIIQQKKLFRF